MNTTVAPLVKLKTSQGDITLELYPDKAPVTVKNFLEYVQNHHYDDTLFHRVINGFMVQGGGYTANLQLKKTEAPIKNEANNGLLNTRGTIAMARTSVVDSATAQFFINLVDNTFLNYKGDSPQDYGYCVFGKVVEGMDVVDKIGKVETRAEGAYRDLPAKEIKIIKAEQLNKQE